jgi:hypothetical protein
MAGPIRSSFVNIARNAAAGAASSFVSGVAGSLRSGLGGSSSSSSRAETSTGFIKDPLILLYPEDVGMNAHQASYILFTGYSISSATLKPIINSVKVENVMKRNVFGVDDIDTDATKKLQAKADLAAAEESGQTGTSLTLARRNIPKSGTVIGLYMPPAVNVSYSMDYEQAPIGAMGEAIAGIIKDIQSGSGVMDAVGSAAGTAGTALKQMAVKGIDAIIPGAKDLIAIETGTIISPRTELMFRGIGRRDFSFTFTFIPKNQKESKTVKAIVQKFKEGMTPTFRVASSTREMNIPDVFEIAYMHVNKKNSYLNRIGKCYLEKMDVTYGGDKFVTYNNEDGDGPPPQKTVIVLSFKELEIMDRNKINEGY